MLSKPNERIRTVVIGALVALSIGCAACSSTSQPVSMVIELGRNSNLRQPVTTLEPGEAVMWSNHGQVVRRLEISGRPTLDVQPGAEVVTTFDHAGKWVALDPDLAQVIAVIEVAKTP